MQNKIKEWVKHHKKELAVAGGVIISATIIIWNKDALKALFRSRQVSDEEMETILSSGEILLKANFSEGFLDNLTGNKLTATELGNRALCSAQAINKRLIAEGLVNKLPCGDYFLTEKGKMVGEWVSKITPWGYSCDYIKWDEKVLEILFTENELNGIAQFKAVAEEIWSRPAV